MRAGPHEALKQIAAGDGSGGLEALLAALRDFEAAQPGSGIDALCHLLDVYPELRSALRGLLREMLGDNTAAALYAETGILANSGFFTELTRRLIGRLLPAPRDLSLNGQFGALFDSGDDAEWLAHISPADGARVVAALNFSEDDDAAWLPARLALLDAIDLLSVRVAAIGVEPELQRHYRVPRTHNNPFLAQNAALQEWLAAARIDEQPPAIDQLDVLLAQCDDVTNRVHRSARTGGASLHLTFLLRRLQQSLARMHQLLMIAAAGTNNSGDAVARRLAFAVELALAEGADHDIRAHLRESTELIALLATENASRTGEHYITETRSEYFAMLRAAMGAGLIIGLMAMAKMGIGSLHLPALVEALGFGLNYAAGFTLIYILHFTVATKQPAMTAQTLAAGLAGGRQRRVDIDAVSLIVSQVSRTQFIAVLGNVILAAPVALLAAWLLVAGTGSELPAHKAPHLLHDVQPFTTPALFYAAIAGVWLFVAGLVNAYIDNLATYERLGDRVRRMRWLPALAGAARHERFAGWIEDNIGGVAGNVFFGFALGMTGFFGSILGLPLDIRHVTFAATNVAIAAVGENFALPLATLAMSLLGVLLIALVNLAVSFSLAMWVALSARGESVHDIRGLIAAIGRRFLASPQSFFLPPRNGSRPLEGPEEKKPGSR